MTAYARFFTSLAVDDDIFVEHLNTEFDTIFSALGSQGIGTVQLEDLSVTEDKLGVLSVVAAKIGALAITGVKLNSNVVDDITLKLSANKLSIKSVATLWTPSAYAGEESIAYPNGLIMKVGKTTNPSGDIAGDTVLTETVAFGSDFSEIISVQVTYNDATASASITSRADSIRFGIQNVSVSGFVIVYSEAFSATQDADGFSWTAIGR